MAPEKRFNVVWSGVRRNEVKRLIERAIQADTQERLAAALDTIRRRLETDPWNFGDMQFNRRHMRTVVHLVIIPPVSLYYDIHMDEATVFIGSITGLSGSGLEE